MSLKKFPTYDKTHAVTIVATVPILPNRFVAHCGHYAKAQPDFYDACQGSAGVSETAAAVGEVVAVVTSYSYLVESADAIPKGTYVRPSTDDTGRAEAGASLSYCGISLTAATAAGQLIEVALRQHIHAVGDPEVGSA